MSKTPSAKNRSVRLTEADKSRLRKKLLKPADFKRMEVPVGTYNGDCLDLLNHIPEASVNLLFLDPPYNLAKEFKSSKFCRRTPAEYGEWLSALLARIKTRLTKNATIYICGDWYSSLSIYQAAGEHFIVRNRICWEREKGRGASRNWKNSSEDIWFCTMSDSYVFNLDRVKLRRKVIAPYRNEKGEAKDWTIDSGTAFRDTHPSNFWTDISIPFWSMPENTEHPTQKSEKLLAKLILASSNENDLVFDPFLGSGTTSVVAKKLHRKYLGADIDETYCLLAEKRLELAETESRIQGFADGVFWERNTLAEQIATKNNQKQNGDCRKD